MRKAVCVTLSQDIIDWLKDKVNDGTFRNRSHGIEKSIADEKAREGD